MPEMPEMEDVLVTAGVLCLAVGVWLAWGAVALVFFVGGLLIVVGMLMA